RRSEAGASGVARRRDVRVAIRLAHPCRPRARVRLSGALGQRPPRGPGTLAGDRLRVPERLGVPRPLLRHAGPSQLWRGLALTSTPAARTGDLMITIARNTLLLGCLGLLAACGGEREATPPDQRTPAAPTTPPTP